MSFIHTILLISFSIFLQACAISPVSKPNEPAVTQTLQQQHLANIATITQFSLKGRIGVQADGKGFSGGINWQHQFANDDIGLYSPLGGQVASIKKTADKVTLEDAKGNSVSATNAEALTQSVLGWDLPLTGLADWAIGRPATRDIQAITWDEQGHVASLNQDGWQIEYQQYAEKDGHFLPNKIVLRNDKVYLKLLVETWSDVGSDLN